MTSKIVVNNIEADSGINTITFINEVTAPTFNGNIVGTAATFSGNVDIAGALTYEDVTNVDSVGIVTARSGIHVTGGSVGLGTDNPSQLLHLHSDSAHQILLKRGGQYPSECKFSNSGNLLTISNNKNGIHFDVGSSSLATAMYIEDGGNIGIGTDNPGQKLTVRGTTSLMATNSTNQWMAYTYTDNTFRLNYNGVGADELTITSAGLVGINCTPLSRFQVKSGTNQNIALTSDDSEAAIEAYNDAGSANVPLRIRGSEIKFKIDGTQRARLYYSSNSAVLALGDESNSAGHIRLEAKASENQIHGRSNHPITFLINTGEKLKLHTSGLLEGKGAQFTANVTPSSGRGVEIFEVGTGVGQIASFNRDGNGWDELRIKGSEVKLYAGTTNTLTLNLQSTQSTLYGTSDGILNLDTTDSRGSFIRYKENGTTKCWAGCSQGLGTGGNQDDFGIRATRDLIVRTGSSNSMRLTAAGYLQVASDGNISGDNENIFQQHQTAYNVLQLRAETSSYAAAGGGALSIGVIRSASSSYVFGGWYSGNNSSNFQDRKFSFRGDGNAYADGSWNGGGADYAEYFEWSDGNTSSEDRRGISVVLDGDKIREATSGEDPIGVISANPSVVGDADDLQWKNKYLRTEYGSFDLDENGEQKLNPDYNPNQEYVSRENRPEWDCVGLMGKLRIRKGQITGSRWIKMRDVSANVEEWLVR